LSFIMMLRTTAPPLPSRGLPLDHPGRIQALGRVLGRHPDVHHRELRLLLPDDLDKLLGVADLPDDLEPGAVQQAGQALAQQDVIVG
jgi:hypothetical protein